MVQVNYNPPEPLFTEKKPLVTIIILQCTASTSISFCMKQCACPQALPSVIATSRYIPILLDLGSCREKGERLSCTSHRLCLWQLYNGCPAPSVRLYGLGSSGVINIHTCGRLDLEVHRCDSLSSGCGVVHRSCAKTKELIWTEAPH